MFFRANVDLFKWVSRVNVDSPLRGSNIFHDECKFAEMDIQGEY